MEPGLVLGPPGSGKTTHMMRQARAAAAAGRRVWWVGLPAQRAHVLRLATREGPLLGFEFLTPQQLAYRLLADARRLRPLLTGTGRLALVGEALAADRSDPPSPGEARLFARAIAEAKRHDLPAGRIPGDDAETARLRRVFAAYERLKGDAWDYDDFRLQATAWAAGPEADAVEPDLVLVDGFREISPLDLRLVRALARHVPVRLALAVAPPDVVPDTAPDLPLGASLPARVDVTASQARGDGTAFRARGDGRAFRARGDGRAFQARGDVTTLAARGDVTVRAHRFANPVAEARWVLRDIKARLAAGADPLDLALIVPAGRARAVAALADEFGVPLMDETPRGLADRPEGRRLLDLLDLPDHPTASRLLGVPELHGLGAAALDAGVAGRDAVALLAETRGEGPLWAAWIRRLEVPDGDPMPWGEALVDAALAAVHGADAAVPTGDPDDDERLRDLTRFREHALQRLAEARRVAHGPHVRAWWAALLQETTTFTRPDAGVALVLPDGASGRRFRVAWLLGAAEGAYGGAEREDYFVPEDLRAPLAEVFARAGLPRRFLGRGDAELEELRARGDLTIVTVAEGDQAGPLAAESALLGGEPTAAPVLPAGSRLELPGATPYRPPEGAVALGEPEVEALGRYARCGFRYWAETRLCEEDEVRPAWRDLRRTLRSRPRWTASALRGLAGEHPGGADWLERHADTLAGFTFGVVLRDDDGTQARLDGARRRDGEAVLVRFAAPGAVPDALAAERILDARSREYWAAAHLFERYGRQVRRVHLWLWPLDGDPVPFPDHGLAAPWGRMKRVRRDVAAALPAWRAGTVAPTPGWACRDCGVFDVCREGRR